MKRLNNENLTTLKGKNYNIYELENLNEMNLVYADKESEDTYYYKDFTFKINKIKCDINGNPVYKIVLNKNFENSTHLLKGLVTKTYINKGYALIQTYNLAESLKRIFEELTR